MSPADPSRVKPIQVELSWVKPSQAESSRVEPNHVEPIICIRTDEGNIFWVLSAFVCAFDTIQPVVIWFISNKKLGQILGVMTISKR